MRRNLTSLILALPLALTSCGNHDDAADGGGGGHTHDPLFGGALVELGDHFANLEVVYDADAGALDLYLLDGHAEKAVKGPQVQMSLILTDGETAHELVAEPQVSELAGNVVGSSSRFRVVSEDIKGLDAFDMVVGRIEIMGSLFENVEYSYRSSE